MEVTSAQLDAWAREAGLDEPAIVVCSLETGDEASLEPLRPLPPASMIKVPIAACLMAEVCARRIDGGAGVLVRATNLTTNDSPSPFVAGVRTTPLALADAMLTRSDNVATNELIDLLGRERITAYARRIGLAQTHVRRKLSGSLPLIDDPGALGRNSHPAADAAALFSAIATRSIAGAEWLASVLERAEWNDKLSPGLAAGDRFAHKTGETDEVRHDGGILTLSSGRRYVVVVYTALRPAGGDAPLAAFMRLLRAAFD